MVSAQVPPSIDLVTGLPAHDLLRGNPLSRAPTLMPGGGVRGVGGVEGGGGKLGDAGGGEGGAGAAGGAGGDMGPQKNL